MLKDEQLSSLPPYNKKTATSWILYKRQCKREQKFVKRKIERKCEIGGYNQRLYEEKGVTPVRVPQDFHAHTVFQYNLTLKKVNFRMT